MMSLADPDPRFRNASRVVRHKCSTPNKYFWRRTTLSSWDLPFCFIELPRSSQMPFRWRSSVGFDLRNLRTCENISILESPHFQNLTRKKNIKTWQPFCWAPGGKDTARCRSVGCGSGGFSSRKSYRSPPTQLSALAGNGWKVGDLSDLGGWRRVASDLTNACGGTGC